MKTFYYFLRFLCFVTLILPVTCTLMDADRCIKLNGRCKKDCHRSERRIDSCFLPNKVCCIKRLLDKY
ncbi:beta-defensin 114 [Carlito syrichta]|uniref:Beta-defensin n=1 Tax=Carlito syrichta TaxID=1868482 RepID=A0A3Q0DS27_CARSF|nr:beta-defensin 114 [Carlito syrichta]